MSQIGNATLVATSGSITLVPVTGQAGSTPAQWRETGAASIQASSSATLLVARPSKDNMRASTKYRQPLIRVVNGVDTVAGYITYDVKVTCPVQATAAELLDAEERFVSLMGSTYLQDAHRNLIASF